MTERRRYEDEPRSEAQADLGGGMRTYYLTGTLASPNIETGELQAANKPGLTSQQKNYRARRLEEEHLRRKETLPLEPSHEALRAMSEDERARIAGRFRELRGILSPDIITPPAAPEETQLQLPFEEQ